MVGTGGGEERDEAIYRVWSWKGSAKGERGIRKQRGMREESWKRGKRETEAGEARESLTTHSFQQ
jgi:hypothetical protein